MVTLTHAAAAPVHNVDGCGAAAAAPAADTMCENRARTLAAAMLLPKGLQFMTEKLRMGHVACACQALRICSESILHKMTRLAYPGMLMKGLARLPIAEDICAAAAGPSPLLLVVWVLSPASAAGAAMAPPMLMRVPMPASLFS